MATLEFLKQALRQRARMMAGYLENPLSDIQYNAGFDILMRGSESETYESFILPQLARLMAFLLRSRVQLSVLEIGPGPKSLFGHLPDHLRRRIKRYTAFEPNGLFSKKLEEWLFPTSEMESPLPLLESRPDIRHTPFTPQDDLESDRSGSGEKYDIVLFCHSMYGMKQKHIVIRRALEMLVEGPQDGIIAVFHRDGALNLDDLACHRTVSFPTGSACIADEDEILDRFTPFIAGFTMQDAELDTSVRARWREICRALGSLNEARPGHLWFSSPNIMATFTKDAIATRKLTTQVPSVSGKLVKNSMARLQYPTSIVRPVKLEHIQQCVRWALKHRVCLTIIGGGHGGHCVLSGVVAVDMSAFEEVHVIAAEHSGRDSGFDSGALVVVGAGCKTGDIISKTMAVGLTVPLGSRPSVGPGLWLQGGIGHLARLQGLACDAIVGAVLVSVDSSQVLCIGCVPSEHRPVGAVCPENEVDILWAVKGAGTNVGIVVSVTFKAHPASTYLTHNWVFPLSDSLEASHRLTDLNKHATQRLSRSCSLDAYLYWDVGKLHLGVTMYQPCTTGLAAAKSTLTPISTPASKLWGLEGDVKAVDGVGLFETDMYMSRMHGGHGGGKISSFKRCIFLKHIGEVDVASRLTAAVEARPSPLCYLHLMQGGGAISNVAPDATAFGCRDWEFACVITGVWPRDQDGTEAAHSAVQWVYSVVGELLPLSSGMYGADLGPDPRDAALAAKAFGANGPRLALLKHRLDPHNVLAYACQLLPPPMKQRLIVLVTGKSCAGKDYCAEIWASALNKKSNNLLTARAVSISDATKQEYAAATGANLDLLLRDRAYKEQHRAALTAFFEEQVRQRPRLPEEHFLRTVHAATNVDVLLITGIRDQAPIAALAHLVSDCKLVEVCVQASAQTRRSRKGCSGDSDDENGKGGDNERPNTPVLDYRPSLVFNNDAAGEQAIEQFAQQRLVPFIYEDLQRLADMVRQIPGFPRPGIEFRHVLGILQRPDGLSLCTSLLQTYFIGSWGDVNAIVCCEAGGIAYASALALEVKVPLVLVREAGRLPPPTISVAKSTSYVSSLGSASAKEKRIEIEQDAILRDASVVVIDDVLSTGKTLYALLQLLAKAGIAASNVSIMVVAEFPVHCGRRFLYNSGFGRVSVQSLLVFGGA